MAPENQQFTITGEVLHLKGFPTPDAQEETPLYGISTDEIIPNRVCLQYTGREVDLLGNNVLTGLRGGNIKTGDIMNGGYEVIVAGPSFGRGSSRYHAPIALREAGIRIIVTEPERIFAENAVNAGIDILSPDDPAAIELLANRSIDIATLRKHLSPVSKDIMSSGSLVSYLRLLEEGHFEYPIPKTAPRPMTMIEKMIAQRAYTDNHNIGVPAVKPGDECIIRPDLYYGYELQTTIVRSELEREFGNDISLREPNKAILFNDHTALLRSDAIAVQQSEQKQFAGKYGVVNFENDPEKGAPAICHTKMLEDYAEPGQIILGNDSHTCTLGAVNAVAIGKGAADLAGALAFDKMIIKVPETIRVNLKGKLRNGATMKDFMLHFGSTPELKGSGEGKGIASGRVLEFGGDALHDVPIDEQLKLTNMAVELQAFTGIIEPNMEMYLYMSSHRGMNLAEFDRRVVTSDTSATYACEYDFNLDSIEPTVATPGDAQNGVPLSKIEEQRIAIQKAYIGSCTHGTPEDLRQAAEVLKGKKIAANVKLYVQASSLGNLQTSEELGYIQDLLDAGAELLPIGCGACMNAGPGSTEEGEVGIFATNRNFPGRTGKGETYLANPAVVAASAIKGTICGPESLEIG